MRWEDCRCADRGTHYGKLAVCVFQNLDQGGETERSEASGSGWWADQLAQREPAKAWGIGAASRSRANPAAIQWRRR